MAQLQQSGQVAHASAGSNPIDTEGVCRAVRTTQHMSITLPNDMADIVRTKVRSGEYASESEVIRDGLRALVVRDRAVENWLARQLGPAHDALKDDPSRAVTADQVRARLAAEHVRKR